MNKVADQYRIVISMRTASGFLETACFLLGTGKEEATILFRQLEGKKDEDLFYMLRLDLLEQSNGADKILQTIHCSLVELTKNTATITKEIFRLLALEKEI